MVLSPSTKDYEYGAKFESNGSAIRKQAEELYTNQLGYRTAADRTEAGNREVVQPHNARYPAPPPEHHLGQRSGRQRRSLRRHRRAN